MFPDSPSPDSLDARSAAPAVSAAGVRLQPRGLLSGMWLLLTASALLFCWQALVGWPFSRAIRLTPAPGAGVQSFRLPSSYAGGDWYNCVVRARLGGKALTRFVDRDALLAAGRPGFAVKSRSVHVWLPEQEHPKESLSILTPFTIPLPLLLSLLTAWCAATFYLCRVRTSIAAIEFHRLQTFATSQRANWALWGVAAAVAGLALGVRILGLSFPSWENDTPTHLDGVFQVYAGSHPVVTPDRPFGYPVVMGLLMRCLGDLRVIVAAQALASITSATVVTVLLWQSISRFVPHSSLRLVCSIGAVFAAGWFLLNEGIIQREWALLPEAWMAFYLGVQAWLVWRLVLAPRSLFSASLLFAGLSLAAVLAFFTKPTWGFSLALIPLVWLVQASRPGRSFRAWLGWCSVGAIIFLATAAAGFLYQQACTKADPLTNLAYRARALVCWHVPLVRKEIDRRLALVPPDPSRASLQGMADVLDHELANARSDGIGSYPSLGYNPDRLFFKSLPRASGFRTLPAREQTRLCTELFVEALKRDPGMYLQKVGSQMAIFFQHPYSRNGVRRGNVEEDLTHSFESLGSYKNFPPEIRERYAATLRQVKERFDAPWPSAPRLALGERMSMLALFLGSALPWMWGAAGLILCTLSLVPTLRRLVHWRQALPSLYLGIWALGSVLLSCLSVAVTQGLDVQRYIEIAAPLTLLSQFLLPLTALFLACTAVERLRPLRGSAPIQSAER